MLLRSCFRSTHKLQSFLIHDFDALIMPLDSLVEVLDRLQQVMTVNAQGLLRFPVNIHERVC